MSNLRRDTFANLRRDTFEKLVSYVKCCAVRGMNSPPILINKYLYVANISLFF